jgi:hypothetical protein
MKRFIYDYMGVWCGLGIGAACPMAAAWVSDLTLDTIPNWSTGSPTAARAAFILIAGTVVVTLAARNGEMPTDEPQ